MDTFFKSTTGRLMALSFAIALIVGSASALMPHGEAATFVFCLSLFVPIVLNLVGLATAIDKDPEHVMLSVILLPFLLFLWTVGIGVVREFHPHFAYVFIAYGLGALGVALRPSSHAGFFPRHPAAQH